MTKTKFVVITAATALALTGCAARTAVPSAPATVTVTSSVSLIPPLEVTASPNAAPDTTSLFLTSVRTENAVLLNAPDASLVALGNQVCTSVGNDGLSGIAASLAITKAAPGLFTVYQAGYFVGVAVGDLCPQFASQVSGG